MGIDNMFGEDSGEIWDILWETAVKVRYSNSKSILQRKGSEESYRLFFLRNQEGDKGKLINKATKPFDNELDPNNKMIISSGLSKPIRKTITVNESVGSDSKSTRIKKTRILEGVPAVNIPNSGIRRPHNRARQGQRSTNPILRK